MRICGALSDAAVADTLGEVVRRRWACESGVRCVGWGAVAQLGERLVRNEEVSGSIPLSSTKTGLSLTVTILPFALFLVFPFAFLVPSATHFDRLASEAI